MPSEIDVHAAADAIQARGEAVSQHSVLDELRKTRPDGSPGAGGTQRTVGPHVKSWKAARDHDPREDLNVLPVGLRRRLEKFAGDLWVDAVAEASARFDDERRRLAAQERAGEALRVEATIMAENYERLFQTWRVRAIALEGEGERLRGEVDALARQLDHVRSEEYWDRVMQEVYALMPDTGSLAHDEIMGRLSRATLRGDRLMKKRLDANTLVEKIDVRVRNQRYFAKDDGGGYRRLPDWDGRTGILRAGRRSGSS